AEDGIRDKLVTGVQTCALPILGVMLLSVLLAKVFPLLILPLFYPSKPLERPALIQRLERMAGGTGLRLTGVYNLELSKDTKKAKIGRASCRGKGGREGGGGAGR